MEFNDSSKGLNFRYIYEVSGYNRDFTLNLLKVINKGLNEYPKKMQIFLESKDFLQLRETAHKFKSSIAYLYFDEFDRILDAIECSEENHLKEEEISKLVKKAIEYSSYTKKSIDEELTNPSY
ncbi:MAG: hypothetical protein OHK0038_07990 [Flammeovirgaceae bacterium]